MCGIAGIINLDSNKVPTLESIRGMISIMQYRGPDESGIYIDDHAALGHNRLSIIDLANGSQPICNEDKTLWIIYNGEVYNYPELHKNLLAKGHKFRTDTDTEVILHLFEDKGVECVNDLNGQFAIAIWDSSKRKLFLARDRFGVRPIHYAICNNTFFFASEVKAILSASEIPRKLNLYALDQIFTFWTTLPGQTIFKNIFELKPGHFITVVDGTIKEKKYWELPVYNKDELLTIPPSQICEQIRGLITEAVRIRLRADVPVGAYLSGGLDSSGISAIIKNQFNADVHTFGIRFEEERFDEGIFQNEMTSFLNIKSHYEVKATNDLIASNFYKVLWHGERPILRTAPVPLYLLSKLVREKGIVVVLTGEGADEIFGGYDIFKEALIRTFLSRQPQSSIRPLLLGSLYKDVFGNNGFKQSTISFFSQGLQQVSDPLFSHLIRWNNTKRIKALYSDEVKDELKNYDCIQELKAMLPETFYSRDMLGKAQYLEIILFLSNYLLSSQGDRVAMANSIEIRFPYLDHNLVDFMAKVPSVWKILGLNEKHILKSTFKGILPDTITTRTKHPYRAPVSQALFSSNSGDFYSEHLTTDRIKYHNIFNPEAVFYLRKKMEKSSAHSEIDSMALAGLLSTQIVADQFIAKFPNIRDFPSINLTVFVDERSSKGV